MEEQKIERRLKKEIELIGGKALKFVSPGVSGVPDRIVLLPGGKVIFVELKASGKKLRPIQELRRKEFNKLGFDIRVISMSIFEYDKEEEEKKLRKAEFEAGREAGFLEGQKHAALQSSIESAKRMLKSNKLSPEDISIFSGLSLDEVKKLQL